MCRPDCKGGLGTGGVGLEGCSQGWGQIKSELENTVPYLRVLSSSKPWVSGARKFNLFGSCCVTAFDVTFQGCCCSFLQMSHFPNIH